MIKVNELRKLFKNTSIKIKRKKGGSFPITYNKINAYLPEKDCIQYFQNEDKKICVSNTGLFFPGYYEQLIIINNLMDGRWRLFRKTSDNKNEIIIKSRDNKADIILSGVSNIFLLEYFKNKNVRKYLARLVFGFMPIGRRMSEKKDIEFSEIFSRTMSIKVKVTEESYYYNHLEKLKKIAEAGLYHISFGKGVSLSLLNKVDDKRFRRGYVKCSTDVNFPLRTYNSDLIAYYQMSLSSNNLILSYLSLYKIIEHFFLEIKELVLNNRVSDLLVKPDFSHKKTNDLRQLTKIVRNFDQKMDERKMLTSVLEHYFMTDEISDWLDDLEDKVKNYYISSQHIFGEEFKLDINPKQLYSSLAKRIYHIRNVIVHSKEGELPKFIPFSGQEEVIERELILLYFLAENLIVKTGKDI